MTALRLFFALWPDDATRRQLAKASRPALKRCGGRPVPARMSDGPLVVALLDHWPAVLLLGGFVAFALAAVQRSRR